MKRAAVPLLSLLCLGLAACTSSGQPQASLPPPGPDCGPLIDAFMEQLREDVESGKMKRDVYGRATSDTRQAAAACSAGRQVQARSILIATKRNYGYEL